MTADEWLDSVIACYKGQCRDCDPCLSLQCSGYHGMDLCVEILLAAKAAGVVVEETWRSGLVSGYRRVEGER